MIQTYGQFGEAAAEHPNSHLKYFLDVCNKFLMSGVTQDQLKMIIFPYSLKDAAKIWLNRQPSVSIHTQEELAEKLLEKYFQPTANSRLDWIL